MILLLPVNFWLRQELVLAEVVRKRHPTLQPLRRKLETSLSLDRLQLQALPRVRCMAPYKTVKAHIRQSRRI